MRGDVYLADLNPSRGSEQAGIRPVILVQRNTLDRFTTTVVVIPITSNLRRAKIPGTMGIKETRFLGETGFLGVQFIYAHLLRLF
ncbi:type II toxin-antitoxin system PemK/MazF family toxin [Argonema antarcticum]|uniref:type II toxin-antitoxin system PemK/MazF family toxin n=1 Tax=Argonema antarcticum TaxID=2942763 RepID=UPI003B8452A8|nr:type II toxin-antitoxin system PemK/MazF family toxin [Argonema antarcticum A004/B2]